MLDYLREVFVVRLDWWVALGFTAQLCFGMRFILQWIASERVGKSVIPIAFWWFSILGTILLLIYAVYRRDPVFIVGQLLGMIVYVRNLHFIFREKRAA